MLTNPIAEFDRQSEFLEKQISAGIVTYPIGSFTDQIAELRVKLSQLVAEPTPQKGNIPVVLVLKQSPFPHSELVRQFKGNGREGYIEMTPKVPEDFRTIDDLVLPTSDIYFLWDTDTGQNRLNISPADSLPMIHEEGRTPLTMQEGIFATLSVPELFTKSNQYNCIQMPGSRIENDLRVPSIWMSKGAPRLGWCWFGNIHTWLATASVASRIAAG